MPTKTTSADILRPPPMKKQQLKFFPQPGDKRNESSQTNGICCSALSTFPVLVSSHLKANLFLFFSAQHFSNVFPFSKAAEEAGLHAGDTSWNWTWPTLDLIISGQPGAILAFTGSHC